MQEWYLGWEKLSCLERCPHFMGQQSRGSTVWVPSINFKFWHKVELSLFCVSVTALSRISDQYAVAFGGFADKRAIPYAFPNQDPRAYHLLATWVWLLLRTCCECSEWAALVIWMIFLILPYSSMRGSWGMCVNIMHAMPCALTLAFLECYKLYEGGLYGI